MQHFRSLALLGLVAVCEATAGCNADNCLRALQNTARPGLADCASYFAHVVTPSTTTFTVTATAFSSTSAIVHTTLTSTEDVEATTTVLYTAAETDTAIFSVTDTVLAKRSASTITTTSTPTSAATIPAYASPCTSAARYSSACACAGFILSTATAPTPSTTITVTQTMPTTITTQVAVDTTAVVISTTDTTLVTSTVGTLTSTVTSTDVTTSTSTTSAPASLPTNFVLYGIASPVGEIGSPNSDSYVGGGRPLSMGTPLEDAATFSISPEGYLQFNGTDRSASPLYDGGGYEVQMMDPVLQDIWGVSPASCSVDPDSLLLSCRMFDDEATFSDPFGEVWLMADWQLGVYPTLQLQAIYVS